MDIAALRIDRYLDAVASERVAPSAGSVAAVNAAAGVALGEMGCLHTDDRTETARKGMNLAELRAELRPIRSRLVELAQADANAVDELRASYNEFDAERQSEPTVTAQKNATDIPLEIAAESADALGYVVRVAERASTRVTPDVVVGALLIQTAIRTTAWLSRLNAANVDDHSFESEIENRTNELMAASESVFGEISALVEDEYGIPLG